MPFYHYRLTFRVKTPFLSKKVGAQHFGYDMSMLKDADGFPVFLGSQIRGNLRHALQHFQKLLEEQGNQPEKRAELEHVLSGFGDSSDKNDKENFNPRRANLNFAYYWQLSEIDKQKAANHEPRYRIGIDKATGTVQTGNLQVIESYLKTGLSVDFTGEIATQLTKEQAKITEYWLAKAAQFIPAIGALKGTGFGKIETATLTCHAVALKTHRHIPENTERFGIVLTLDRPFCLAQPHLPDSNRFVSHDYIAGNVILGAIAEQYSVKKEQKNGFDKIHLTHALPAPHTNPCRMPVLPLSLAFFGDELKDLALINPREEKVFLYQKEGKLLAPEFQPDWKQEKFTVAKQLLAIRTGSPLKDYQSSYQRQLVVHTAIAEGTVQADDGKLFSLECINPKQAIWCADVDLSGMDKAERKAAMNVLQNVINGGLQGIGKTKACATVAVHKPSFLNKINAIAAIQGKYVVTLQTDARLFAAHNIQATNGQQALHQLYADYWQQASDGQLSLSHYYAQQMRVGGQFYWQYYQQNQQDKSYQPQWLTKAGSVFVLTATEKATAEAVQKLLNDWQLHGLPQANDKKDSTWQNNPFIRENGFGEVLINAQVYQQLSVNESEGKWL